MTWSRRSRICFWGFIRYQLFIRLTTVKQLDTASCPGGGVRGSSISTIWWKQQQAMQCTK
jgi:hypothetical protein